MISSISSIFWGETEESENNIEKEKDGNSSDDEDRVVVGPASKTGEGGEEVIYPLPLGDPTLTILSSPPLPIATCRPEIISMIQKLKKAEKYSNSVHNQNTAETLKFIMLFNNKDLKRGNFIVRKSKNAGRASFPIKQAGNCRNLKQC